MREAEQVKAATPLPIEPNAPINPHVMQEMERLNARINVQNESINVQNETMQAMWKRWEKMFEREKWLQEAYPEIVAQHEAVEDLKRASMSAAQGMGVPAVEAVKKMVNYDGDI